MQFLYKQLIINDSPLSFLQYANIDDLQSPLKRFRLDPRGPEPLNLFAPDPAPSIGRPVYHPLIRRSCTTVDTL